MLHISSKCDTGPYRSYTMPTLNGAVLDFYEFYKHSASDQ
jgi:hypothetical protein